MLRTDMMFLAVAIVMIGCNLAVDGCTEKVICERYSATVTCPEGKVIMIDEAVYGRTDTTTCRAARYDVINCIATTSLQKTRARCQNKNTCNLWASNAVYGDPCRGKSKYLRFSYTCQSPDSQSVGDKLDEIQSAVDTLADNQTLVDKLTDIQNTLDKLAGSGIEQDTLVDIQSVLKKLADSPAVEENITDVQVDQETVDDNQSAENTLRAFMNYVLTNQGWYKGNNELWYKLVTDNPVDYAGAISACEAMGAKLATTGMRSADIRDKLREDLWKPAEKTFWVGLDDLEEQFNWMWLDDVSSTSSNTDWANDSLGSEPNNWQGREERCANVDHRWDRWALNDDLCSSEYACLCELAF